jgi:hypothetical protein
MGLVKMPEWSKVLRQLLPPQPVEQLPPEEIMHRMDLWRVAVAPSFEDRK